MRFASLLAIAIIAAPANPGPSTGTGTIYLGSYAARITAIDEATGKVSTEIPLKSGLPWTMRVSADRSRFYVQSANQEQFEIVDVRTRQSVDVFTLSDANRHVRALAYDVDPQGRYLMLVARTATKLIDRFEIGAPEFIQYDLHDHKVVRTVPWSLDPEPRYYALNLRYSPDGKLLYVFAHEILVFDATTLKQVDSWNLSLPNEAGLNRFDLGAVDESNDEPGYFTGLFTMQDPVAKRRLLVVGRVDLAAKGLAFFSLGPVPEDRDLSFTLGADHKRAFILSEQIGEYEILIVDMTTKRVQNTVRFKGRPRMAIRSSTSGQVIYVYEAGNTIDLYSADTFTYLRTITLDADMKYRTFHVLPAQKPAALQ